MLLALLVAGLNIGLWYVSNRPHGPINWQGDVHGFAFSPFQRHQSPLTKSFPSDAQISADLALLYHYSDRIRTYAALENPQIPRLAHAAGMHMIAGAWLNADAAHNASELQALITQAQRYPQTITQVMVGNEVLLRNDLSPHQLMAWLDRARAAIRQPVSTAEPWHIWEKYPELAQHVDFITVHLLPYWEGVPRKDAIGDVLQRYTALQHLFPNKPILIGEIGWPSNGDRFEYAKPSTANEAIFLRQWMTVARARGIDYFLMEAFDQPWKEALGEGRV
ncbi:MAG: benzoate transporter, partial [Xanthomonadales bacterium]|nr:benzoate transporter [Xanthomonadales bacterium]